MGPILKNIDAQGFKRWICNATTNSLFESSESGFILEDSGNFRRRYLAGEWWPQHTSSPRYIVTRCFLSCSLSPRKWHSAMMNWDFWTCCLWPCQNQEFPSSWCLIQRIRKAHKCNARIAHIQCNRKFLRDSARYTEKQQSAWVKVP